MNVIKLDDRRSPHPRRERRLVRMTAAIPTPADLPTVQAHLRRAHSDTVLRAQILAIMKAQVDAACA